MNKILLFTALVIGLALIGRPSAYPKDAGDSIKLTSDNLIVFNQEVDGSSVGAAIAKATELDEKLTHKGILGKLGKEDHTTPLYLYLNTPGGSIQSGLELTEALKGLGRPVHTITAFAASMGFQLVQNLNDRLILKTGVLMSHHAVGQSQGEFGGSVRTQMQNRQQLWDDRVRELDEQTVSRTKGKQTYKSYTEQYDHEMWDTGSKSVAQGYADRIITVKCDKTLSGTTSHSIDFLGMTINYELSNCPLNSAPMNVGIGKSPETPSPLVTLLGPNVPTAPAPTAEYVKRVSDEFRAYFHQKAITPLPLVD